MKQWDSLWTNIHVACMTDGYAEIHNAAIAVKEGKIAWIGFV